jgi:hypothetical protein
VQEATPAFDVVPNVGAANAAERVRLIGRNIGCPAEVLCAEPVVRFGDQTVAIQAAGEDFLEVQPLRGSGTVDVTVTRGSNVIRRVAAFHFFDAGQRPAPEFFTPVLFPTLFSSRGAFGSEWDSELSIRNDNDFPIIAPYALPFPQFPFRNSTQVVSAKAAGLSASGGRLVYVPRRGDHDIHFGLLVRDLSRQGEALGVEVPVVREDDFYEDAFTLMNVPSDSRSRVALRVYALSEMRTVRMRVRTMDAVTPLVNIPVGLSGFAELGQDHFSVAINDLIGAYPVLAGKGALRIEIAPEAGPSARGAHRLWAFASVTNNATQHVTIISPQ